MSPSLSRWLRRLGLALAIAGCAHVAARAWAITSRTAEALIWPGPGPVLLALGCCTLAMAALACGWYLLLRACGEPARMHTAFRSYAISQPAKYLPGNVLHFAARHALGRSAGAGHTPLLSAAALEAATLIGMALSLVGVCAPASMFGDLVVAPWMLGGAGGACLVGAAGYLALLRRGPGLAWLLAYFGLAAAYFLATSFAFWLLCGQSAPGREVTLTAVSASWVAGFVVIGAPGGLGVREASMLQLLGGEAATHWLGAIISLRLVAIGADLVLFASTSLLAQARGSSNLPRR